MNKLLSDLYESKLSVFTVRDAMVIANCTDQIAMSRTLTKLTEEGVLQRLRNGIYALPKYDNYEFGNKLQIPSYLSMETVLRSAGVIFQYDNMVTYASYQTRTIFAENGVVFNYRKLSPQILYNNAGKIYKPGYTIASLERAFLDLCYVDKWRTYENTAPIDKNEVIALLPIYNNKALEKRVASILEL